MIHNGIFVRDIKTEDLGAIAEIHLRVFPNYTTSLLGRAFLKQFYRQFIGKSAHFGYVAVLSGKPVGFVVCTTEKESLYRELYRRSFISLSVIFIWRVLTNPVLLTRCSRFPAHLKRVISAICKGEGKLSETPNQTDTKQAVSRLLSIGVLPEARRAGVAQQLVQQVCEHLLSTGFDEVGLTVLEDNTGAVSFYERTGWTGNGQVGESISYSRSTKQ